MKPQLIDDGGGDSPCWAHLICEKCGSFLSEHDGCGCDLPCTLEVQSIFFPSDHSNAPYSQELMPTLSGVEPSLVQIVRVYDLKDMPHDKYRVLVDRLWPRGISKDSLVLDEWPKELPPSSELRHWYGHEKTRFEEFTKLYRAELTSDLAQATLNRIRKIAYERGVILMTATRDVEHSAARVLLETILQSPENIDTSTDTI